MNVVEDMQELVNYFNGLDVPYKLSIITDDKSCMPYVKAEWKWMDASYFSGLEITQEIKDFAVYYKLDPDGSYRYFDKTSDFVTKTGFNGGGLSLSKEYSAFYGKKWEYHTAIVLGKDNVNDKVGLIGFKLNTTSVHRPIKEWLEAKGYHERKETFGEFMKGIFTASKK